jgi:predicted Ser/Thr protein kinase
MFEPGTQVGRYEIQRKLGRGGMGSVYVAHDPVLGRMVAIKVFAGDLDLPDARERFSREARAAAALSHPNIVTVYDFGEYESQPFIVMEYVAGETLAALIRRKAPVTIADKLKWMEDLCAGAGYAHHMQLVHRDIKPANLMLDRAGRLKILDFGIARMLGLASNTSVMIGTPGYMAPEQITGDRVDHRADQFSIGVVFYELLAYSEAFPGDSLPMITHRILNEEPVPLGRLAPDASPELIAIIQQTLKKSPIDRFPDSESLRAAIARVRRDASNQSWNLTTTVALGRDTPSPPPLGTRGTGSSRRRQDEAVGVAQLTPPPDPRRTDREALARRRAIQLEAALTQARALLSQGQLDSALDACQQALTYDENHVGALRLEEEIEAAMRGKLTADLSPATAANLETLWPNLDVRPSEVATQMDPFPATPSGGVEPTVLWLPTVPPAVPPPDETVIAPPRRTPPPTHAPGVPVPPVMPTAVSPEPASVAQAAVTPVPMSFAPAVTVPAAPAVQPSPAAEAPTAPQRAKAPVPHAPKKPLPIGPMVADIVARSKTIADAANAVVVGVARDRRMLSIAAIAVGVVIVAAAAVMFFSGPAPTGTVVIDAVPWGSITAIETEGGDHVALPPSPSTPLTLTLPAGTYQVVVAGPPPESQTQRITVEIQRDTPSVAPVIRFRALTPEEYFEQYLAAPTAPTQDLGTAPAEPTSPALTPSSPATPSATGSNP